MSDLKSALIMGGSGDIGRAVANRLCREGYRVIIAARDAARLEAACRDLPDEPVPVESIVCDVSDEAAIRATVDAIADRHGRLDVLVNCAGVAEPTFVARMTREKWDEMLTTNALGVVLTCKAVLPLMKRQGGGHIVNIGSTQGRRSDRGMAAYGASKAALVAVGDSLRSEVAHHGIKVSMIGPDRVHSRMHEGQADRPDELLAVDDVAEAVAFVLRLSSRATVRNLYLDLAALS